MIGKLDFIFKTILGELLGLPRLLILVGRFHMFAHVCAAFSITPHPKTVSVLHKKGIHDNIFWGDFSLYHQFVWLKTIEIRLVVNTSRHRWAEIRSLPQSLWMGELIRWFLSLLFSSFFSCYCFFLLAPSGALIAIPTYYWPSSTTTPLFQITPVLNTGLSLSEPLQLYKGYNAI